MFSLEQNCPGSLQKSAINITVRLKLIKQLSKWAKLQDCPECNNKFTLKEQLMSETEKKNVKNDNINTSPAGTKND